MGLRFLNFIISCNFWPISICKWSDIIILKARRLDFSFRYLYLNFCIADLFSPCVRICTRFDYILNWFLFNRFLFLFLFLKSRLKIWRFRSANGWRIILYSRNWGCNIAWCLLNINLYFIRNNFIFWGSNICPLKTRFFYFWIIIFFDYWRNLSWFLLSLIWSLLFFIKFNLTSIWSWFSLYFLTRLPIATLTYLACMEIHFFGCTLISWIFIVSN